MYHCLNNRHGSYCRYKRRLSICVAGSSCHCKSPGSRCYGSGTARHRNLNYSRRAVCRIELYQIQDTAHSKGSSIGICVSVKRPIIQTVVVIISSTVQSASPYSPRDTVTIIGARAAAIVSFALQGAVIRPGGLLFSMCGCV